MYFVGRDIAAGEIITVNFKVVPEISDVTCGKRKIGVKFIKIAYLFYKKLSWLCIANRLI